MSGWQPRSLAAQMALLIAAALFVAQAINFGLALRDRRAFRLAQATRPAATRIADALEREAQGGRAILPDRGRVRRVTADPVPPSAPRDFAQVAAELRRQLTELGVTAGRIDIGLVRREEDPPRRRLHAPERGGPPRTLLIAVEQPGRGWLTVSAPWPDGEGRLLWALLIQTLVLYTVVLLPVLWAARRISRPLRALAREAGAFAPGGDAEALPEEGPADIRRLVAAFNDLRVRVTAMLDEKDHMLGAIGHDLRTPLAALRVHVESVEDESDRARMAELIADMDRTLDDILSLARVGRPSEPPTDVDLAALVDAVVEDFRDLGQDVSFPEAERLTMRLRPGLMRRAVRNLIENAVKYGGGAEIRLRHDAHQATIVIGDRGPGIPPDRLAAVFDPFTRLEESRNRETGGVGLGLALARAIVRDAGGDISLRNRSGGGLEATILLARRPAGVEPSGGRQASAGALS